eukprot:CAMPEP_0116871294 /NCGR_PEP_ID=MMETSP0463-20121206/1560_1 /TAXON_ID=181622 /ORGANISM="Strombidinopsis sp, Strain SopsisLIS2011" /LENGTH=48 /DNA_ID= /DNA_START= /DNA_END= /DNA_ORIENTATION=
MSDVVQDPLEFHKMDLKREMRYKLFEKKAMRGFNPMFENIVDMIGTHE